MGLGIGLSATLAGRQRFVYDPDANARERAP
jgi:hypothetical protein